MSASEAVKRIAEEIESLQARITLDDECMNHLYKLYSYIWTEACYDPDSAASAKFAGKLLPHIRALNDKLHFKK